MRKEIEPLTSEAFESFYGWLPPTLVRGYVLRVDGKVVGVGGIVFVGDCWLGFADVPEDIRGMRKSIMLVAREMRKLMDTTKLPVIAKRDEDEPTAPRFLAHLGFVEDGDVWRYQR